MFSKTIDLEENIILKNRIPILVNDENWSKIFGGIEDKVIQSTKDELEELLKEQKKAEREIARLQKEKVKAMKIILNICINKIFNCKTIAIDDNFVHFNISLIIILNINNHF